MIKQKLEKETQKEICDWLALNKFFFWRSNNLPVFSMSGSGYKTFRAMPKYSPKGLPDIIVITGGKFIGIEVKRKGAKQSADQVHFMNSCRNNGGEYLLAYTLQDVSDELFHYIKYPYEK